MSPTAIAYLPPSSKDDDGRMDPLKVLVWIYFALLLFEGALRKWILPQLATPLLVVRDPVAIAIYVLSVSRGILPKGFAGVIVALGVLTFALAPLAERFSWAVALFGFRTNFLHLPLIFVLPQIIDRRDVIKFGRALLWLSPVMALIVLKQFNDPPSSWWNVGAGGGEGGQLEAGFGRIRAAGTFSYNTGLTAFNVLAASFLYFSNIEKGTYSTWLLRAGWIATIVCVGLSGSRTSLGAQFVLLCVLVGSSIIRPQIFASSARTVILCILAIVAVSGWSTFKAGMAVLDSRIELSGGVREGIVDRFFGEFLEPFRAAAMAPALGKGFGLGTNAGAGILTGGERVFLLAEGDLARVVLESGPFLGFSYIALRAAIVAYLLSISLAQLKAGNSLPILLWGSSFLAILYGQFGPPTTLGFACIGGGLCLAAARVSQAEDASAEVLQPVKEIEAIPSGRRGRSRYAQELHDK